MNKQLISLALFALLFGAFAQKSQAQASGANPQLFMYRHNGSLGGSPAPVVVGNTIGTLEWRGLTAIHAIRLGATIKSVVTDVSPGSLASNMILSTSDGTLKDRMIITQFGRVGIGTMNPDFDLHTVGNTHTTGRFHGRIHYDVGAATGLPGTYTDEAYFERKNRTALGLGLPANATYPIGGILSLAPGGGSLDRQLFSGGDDGLWTRSQDHAGANDWAAWEKILTSGDINGRPNLVARFLPPGPTSSKLGDSQLFDDGSNVVIGGIPAAPAVPTPAFNVADMLTVNGNSRTTGNSAVNGNATVTGSTTTGTLSVGTTANVGGLTTTNSLSVTNNAQVNGNVGIGKAPTAFDLDVAGQSNFDGRVKIGATSFPSSNFYELAVGGGIIAEEVLVQLEGAWADYVFADDYPLKPLAEVENFIAQEKHLPGVISAKEVAENGLNLGDMQKAQMEKIEELFLHLIALEKRVKQLEEENTALKAKGNK